MDSNSGIEASDMLAEALKQLDNVLASKLFLVHVLNFQQIYNKLQKNVENALVLAFLISYFLFYKEGISFEN